MTADTLKGSSNRFIHNDSSKEKSAFNLTRTGSPTRENSSKKLSQKSLGSSSKSPKRISSNNPNTPNKSQRKIVTNSPRNIEMDNIYKQETKKFKSIKENMSESLNQEYKSHTPKFTNVNKNRSTNNKKKGFKEKNIISELTKNMKQKSQRVSIKLIPNIQTIKDQNHN